MEIYELRATIKNTNTTFIFDFVPENFEGEKITQQFSFVNPIGYTPKFSIDTMRVIDSDKSTLDTVFWSYGLQGDVEIAIYKLDVDGVDYELLSTFAIDFESYQIFDYYSEFALKGVSVIDYYNNIKNTEIQIPLGGFQGETNFPNTQKYINYVSLKSLVVLKGQTLNAYDMFQFQQNNDSKIYNDDISLGTIVDGVNTYDMASIYKFNTLIAKNKVKLNINANSVYNVTFNSSYKLIVTLNLYKLNNGTITSIYEFYNSGELSSGTHALSVSFDEVALNLGTGDFSVGDELFLAFLTESTGGNIVLNKNIVGGGFLDITVLTDKLVVDSSTEKIKYKRIDNILNSLFNGNISIPYSEPIFSFGLTSANQIMKLNDFANIKPREFLSDICTAGGLILNFKIDGSVEIASINSYFNNLFEVDEDNFPINSIRINEYQDLSINYHTDLNFTSVSVGQETNEYDMFTYLIDWNKVLTFVQSGRNGMENLDLTLQKLRADFSGMLDYFYKRSKQITKTSKDNFIFDSTFTAQEGTVYDWFTPRDILYNWEKFLAFCFQNFGKNTLTISSNGGSPDNLVVNTVSQMDDFIINGGYRLLPIEYNFTCLLELTDFSENILTINYNNEDVHLFIIEAETTDNLSEQKIKGLKIQF